MIADLGGGNQTLDMIPYKKDGHDFILIAKPDARRHEAQGG